MRDWLNMFSEESALDCRDCVKSIETAVNILSLPSPHCFYILLSLIFPVSAVHDRDFNMNYDIDLVSRLVYQMDCAGYAWIFGVKTLDGRNQFALFTSIQNQSIDYIGVMALVPLRG